MSMFSFDSVLNGIDGIYNTYNGLFFIMTANNIEKIDSALKNRPSRFRIVREFKKPDLETRLRILENTLWAEESDGLNLDQVLRLREFKEQNIDLKTAMNKILPERIQ